MIEDLIWCIAIYLLYRFIFELAIPVGKTFLNMKKTMAKMQGTQQQSTQARQPEQPKPAKPSTTNTNDEYIDFEEVKD